MNFVPLIIALSILVTLTVAFPLLMVSIYVGLLIYYNYVTPEMHQDVMDFVEKSCEAVRQTCAPYCPPVDETMTRSGIERARRQYMDHCNGVNRSSSEEEKDAKLLLTYQVPILTRYYESIIQFFKRQNIVPGVFVNPRYTAFQIAILLGTPTFQHLVKLRHLAMTK
ncbi:unnamed protein product [Caenorhabditis sp. 36 PRJEB53466]|nr:unnamed protein product [Caenorhabditis sp. 36 PRJEB53466]